MGLELWSVVCGGLRQDGTIQLQGVQVGLGPSKIHPFLPSGYVKIAIENGHL